MRPGSEGICEVDHVSKDGTEVTIRLKGTNMQWFRVPVSKLMWVDRKPSRFTDEIFLRFIAEARLMAGQQSHKHHYVPEWYQKRFLIPGEQQLHLLDLKPATIALPSGQRKAMNACRRRSPSKCFCEEDLYMLRFGKTETDIIEKKFFGMVDMRGAPAVEVFDKITGFSPEIVKAHHHILPYMGAQRFRTPRGLDWLKARTQGGDRNAILLMMQRWFQQHTTMWGEGV